MARDIFDIIYKLDIPTVIVGAIVIVIAWGIVGAVARRDVWRTLNFAVFCIITGTILYSTLLSRSEIYDEVVLVPLHSFVEARERKEMYRSMLMNVLLFIPFGQSAQFLIPEKAKFKGVITVLLAAMLSAAVEYFQYKYSLGRCEVDDVIMNTLGAAIGSASYYIAKRLEKSTR